MNYAVMDIGSNSLRLLVAAAENGELSPLLRRRRIIKLAAGLNESGLISEERMAAALGVISEFSEIARQNNAVCFAFATSAVRDAKNGGLLVSRAMSRCGVSIDVLSGESEARATFAGAAKNRENAALVDIGGGSTELAAIGGGEFIEVSVPRGCVRALTAFCGQISMEEVENWLLSCPTGQQNKPFSAYLSRAGESCGELILSGGSCAVAAAYAMGVRGEYAGQSAGKTFEAAKLCQTARELWQMSVAEREAVPLLADRADSIRFGAALMAAAIKAFGAKTVSSAAGDNLEGYLRLKLFGGAR